jgi:ribose transport system substrate-binding protein
MAQDTDNHQDGVSRRHMLERMMWTATGVLWAVSVSGGESNRFSLFGWTKSGAAMAQTRPTVSVIVKDTTSFYWQTVLAGARRAGQDLGINIAELAAQSESDANGQIGILESVVASNPTAIVIAPAQFAALGKPIDEAAKKVKIIGVDSTADTAALTSMLMTDNLHAGRLAADILAQRIQKTYADAEGDVVLITSGPGDPALDRRAQGFKEQIAARYGALAIVAEKVADGQATTARKVMAEIIAEFPELRGVFASDPVTALGVAQAVAESKTNKTGDTINVVGFDLDDQLIKFLKDGTIAALVVQDPFRMGYQGVETALTAAKGEQVPRNIEIGVTLLTKANMNSARSQELINAKVK